MSVQFEIITKLVSHEGFSFRSWNDRYSKGVWSCIAPHSFYLEAVESVSDAGDLDMIPGTEYLLSTNWLPLVIGNDFNDGLTLLEKRLEQFSNEEMQRTSVWTLSVSEALDHLIEVGKSSKKYGGMDGEFKPLSSDYKKIFKE